MDLRRWSDSLGPWWKLSKQTPELMAVHQLKNYDSVRFNPVWLPWECQRANPFAVN